MQLVQLLRRHVLLRAREGAGDVPVEAVRRGCARPARRRRRRRDEVVEGASWCRASPPTARPATGPSMRRGVVGEPAGSPSASASRLAGSMVTTHRLAPLPGRLEGDARPPWSSCRPRPSRSRRGSSARRPVGESSAPRSRHVGPRAPVSRRVDAVTSRSRRRARRRAWPTSAGPRPAANRNGRWTWGSGRRSARRPTCSCWSAMRSRRNAAPPAQRIGVVGLERLAGLGRPAAAGSASRPETSGYTPFTTTGAEADPDAVLEGEGGLDQLVDRRLLGQRHEHHLARAPGRRASRARRGPGC